MNFLADENVDRQIVDRLRQDGHILKYKSQLPHAFSVITPGAIRIRQRSLWGGIWRMHRGSTFG